MKSFTKELWFEIPTRRAFINITHEVQQCIDESGVEEGLVPVNTTQIWLLLLSHLNYWDGYDLFPLFVALNHLDEITGAENQCNCPMQIWL